MRKTVIYNFFNYTWLKFDECGMESIELVEIYLESRLAALERGAERISIRNTQIDDFYGFLRSNLDFFLGREGVFGMSTSAIDRARRDLFGEQVGRVGEMR
jgi:hypothetical protein